MTIVRCLLLSGFCLAPFTARAMDQTLDAALARIDKASASFKGLTASLKKVQHTELVNANETDEGIITVKRFKQGDIRILIDFTGPETKKVSLGDGKALIYNPRTNEVQVADIKKHRDLINEVLLLGFGATSAEIKAAYTVTLGGPDSVNGTPATRIELVPKSDEIRHSIKKCELWIPENGIPLQQKFFESGGDYQIATYSNIVLKPNLPDSAVRLDLPRGVKKIDLK